MGIEELRKKVMEEAERDAAEILKEARKRAKSIREEILESARREADAYRSMEDDARARARGIVASAKNEARRIIMNAYEEVFRSALEDARKRLHGLTGRMYEDFLRRALEIGKEILGGDVHVYFTREGDEAIVRSEGFSVAGRIDGGGGVIMETGRKRLDITFDGLLSELERQMKIEIIRSLQEDLDID